MTAPTPATQTTLADWLSARLDEDEAAARAAQEWVDLPGFGRTHPALVNRRSRPPHDPARVLADVAARRAIVARYVETAPPFVTAEQQIEHEQMGLYVMPALAAAYSDSPGYDERWAVS